jgi:hypothetical protein
MFTLQNQFQPTFSRWRGGGGNPLVEVTVNSKEENSYDFCPNYVQEFGHWVRFQHPSKKVEYERRQMKQC